MAQLTFMATSVARIVAHAKKAPGHAMGWSDAPSQPAVFLVGDQGVYLMSNGEPADLKAPDNTARFVAYAQGMNPKLDPDWWKAKRASYGGDDGTETLLIIDDLERLILCGAEEIRLEIDAESVALVMPLYDWIKPGLIVEGPSNLGGIFRARVLDVTDTHARVQNTGNCEDFDQMPPYSVPLAKIREAI